MYTVIYIYTYILICLKYVYIYIHTHHLHYVFMSAIIPSRHCLRSRRSRRQRQSSRRVWPWCWLQFLRLRAVHNSIAGWENLNRKPWILPSNIGVSVKKKSIIQLFEWSTWIQIHSLDNEYIMLMDDLINSWFVLLMLINLIMVFNHRWSIYIMYNQLMFCPSYV